MDLNDLMKQISDDALIALVRAGRHELATRNHGALLAALEEWKYDHDDLGVRAGEKAVMVEFQTDDWDDGYSYDSGHAAVRFAGGTLVEVDMSQSLVSDALTELADHEGPLAKDSWLKVDLLKPEITTDRSA